MHMNIKVSAKTFGFSNDRVILLGKVNRFPQRFNLQDQEGNPYDLSNKTSLWPIKDYSMVTNLNQLLRWFRIV